MPSDRSKTMTREEISFLIDLIEQEQDITTKETNAFSNKLKEKAWKRLTSTFNAQNLYVERRMEQLQVKWDNLKKAARKRILIMRNNTLKIGRKEYIGSNEILDRVTKYLRNSYVSEVSFNYNKTSDEDIYEENLSSDPVCSTSTDVKKEILSDTNDDFNSDQYSEFVILQQQQMNDFLTGESVNNEYVSAPESSTQRTLPKSNLVKKRKNSEAMSRIQRNKAIAAYYNAKRKKVDAEVEKINLEIALLKKRL